jgi:micrococcal nuclease
VTRRAKRPGPQRWPWLVAGVVLIALIIADRSGWLLVPKIDDMTAYHGASAEVLRVIDGDTIEIELPDALHDRPVTRIRFWGLDCPETAMPDRPADLYANEAIELTRSLAADRTVTLYLESHRTRGVFGRVLAHVQLPDGSSLNEALLSAGLAVTDERWSHSRLGRYAQLERAARRQGLGMWSQDETGAASDE